MPSSRAAGPWSRLGRRPASASYPALPPRSRTSPRIQAATYRAPIVSWSISSVSTSVTMKATIHAERTLRRSWRARRAPVQTVEPGDDDQDAHLECDLPPGQAGPQEAPRTFAHRRGDEDRRDQAAGIDDDEHGDAQRTSQRRVTEQSGQRRPRGCAHVPVYRDGADGHRLLTLGRGSALILAARNGGDSFRASTVLYDERHTRPASSSRPGVADRCTRRSRRPPPRAAGRGAGTRRAS